MSATVIYDSRWPELRVDSIDEAFMVSTDLAAYEVGDLTADEFFDFWGIHPDANFVIVSEVV